MTYEEAIRYIEEIPRFSETATLADTRRTLAELGNPDRRIGPVIHVAGTNGKGSVCAFLASVLQEAGLKTALFTSPHLIRMNERISIGGEPISDADFLRIFLRGVNSGTAASRCEQEHKCHHQNGKMSDPFFIHSIHLPDSLCRSRQAAHRPLQSLPAEPQAAPMVVVAVPVSACAYS